MKKYLIAFVFVFVFCTFVSSLESANRIKVGVLVSGNPTITYNLDTLELAFEDSWDDGTEVANITIEYHGTTYYLIADGASSGSGRLKGVSLELDDGELFVSDEGSTEHLCVGFNCSACSWLKNPTTGEIFGCTCSLPNGNNPHCDHTMKSPSNFYSYLSAY